MTVVPHRVLTGRVIGRTATGAELVVLSQTHLSTIIKLFYATSVELTRPEVRSKVCQRGRDPPVHVVDSSEKTLVRLQTVNVLPQFSRKKLHFSLIIHPHHTTHGYIFVPGFASPIFPLITAE